MTEHDDKYYQDFVFTEKAKRGMPPQLKTQQERNRAKKAALLQNEVFQWLEQQDEETITHVSEIIRHFMQVKQAAELSKQH